MVPKHSAEMLSSISKCEKPPVCPTENISELDKLASGMSYGAIGRTFNINELTLYIKYDVFERNTHETSGYIDCLMKTL